MTLVPNTSNTVTFLNDAKTDSSNSPQYAPSWRTSATLARTCPATASVAMVSGGGSAVACVHLACDAKAGGNALEPDDDSGTRILDVVPMGRVYFHSRPTDTTPVVHTNSTSSPTPRTLHHHLDTPNPRHVDPRVSLAGSKQIVPARPRAWADTKCFCIRPPFW